MDNWHTKTRKDWTHGSGDILVDIQTHTHAHAHTHTHKEREREKEREAEREITILRFPTGGGVGLTVNILCIWFCGWLTLFFTQWVTTALPELPMAPLSYIFYGVNSAGVSCRRRWPPPTTLALTTLLG